MARARSDDTRPTWNTACLKRQSVRKRSVCRAPEVRQETRAQVAGSRTEVIGVNGWDTARLRLEQIGGADQGIESVALDTDWRVCAGRIEEPAVRVVVRID
jgi:hypothetical protein